MKRKDGPPMVAGTTCRFKKGIMNASNKTADSKVLSTNAFRKALALSVVLGALLATSGCLIPPCIFPKAGAHGKVIDQNGSPLTNVAMTASWLPGRFIPYGDSEDRRITIKPDGTWSFYVRKAEAIDISVYPPEGYTPRSSSFHVPNATVVTNEVVFRFHKVEPTKPTRETLGD